MREFRVDDAAKYQRGAIISTEAFAVGDEVAVIGTSKGKGFQGVVKRHGFHGSPATHGHKDQERMPGSIGAGGVQRVFKGKRMAGHMGDDQVTVKGLEIVKIEPEKNILYIKGALPGSRNSLVLISGEGEMNLTAPVAIEIPAAVEKSVTAEVPVEAPVAAETPVEAPAEIKE